MMIVIKNYFHEMRSVIYLIFFPYGIYKLNNKIIYKVYFQNSNLSKKNNKSIKIEKIQNCFVLP